MEGLTFSQRLRKMADFYDAHPTVPTPTIGSVYISTKAELLDIVKEVGHCEKMYSDMYLNIRIPDQEVEFYTSRGTVCTAKRVETVFVPDQKGYTYDKVLEWECDPLLEPDKEDEFGS